MFGITPVRKLGVLAAALAAVLLTQMALAGSIKAHGEALRLDPAEAKPGDTLAVVGTGFESGTSVKIAMEGMRGEIPLATATPDAQGKFTVNVSIPTGLAAGSYRVIARQGDESVGADFTMMDAMAAEAVVAHDGAGAPAGTGEGVEAAVVYQRSAPETIAIGIIVAAVVAAGGYLVLAGTERRPRPRPRTQQ